MYAHQISPAMVKGRSPWSCWSLRARSFKPKRHMVSSQYSQAQAAEKSRAQVNDSLSRRKPEPSELDQDNYSHVAASSVQIRQVLLIDGGLLMELKRWIAKEAGDEGRIVEDQNLTAQAVFDRLDHDQVFRSVGTRLLQCYG
jgi:hypothetical protein